MNLTTTQVDDLTFTRVLPRVLAFMADTKCAPNECCFVMAAGEGANIGFVRELAGNDGQVRFIGELADQWDHHRWVYLARHLRSDQRTLRPHEFLVLYVSGEYVFRMLPPPSVAWMLLAKAPAFRS